MNTNETLPTDEAPTFVTIRGHLLTWGQVHTIVAAIVGGAVTLNDHWSVFTGISGLHIPVWLTITIQVLAGLKILMGRSLDKSKSGTGTGIIGTPANPTVFINGPSVPPVALLILGMALFLLTAPAHAQTFAPDQASVAGQEFAADPFQSVFIAPQSVFAQSPEQDDQDSSRLAWEGAADVTLILLLFHSHGHSAGSFQGTSLEPVPEKNTGMTLGVLLSSLMLAGIVRRKPFPFRSLPQSK